MNSPILTIPERSNIEGSTGSSKLSQGQRDGILERTTVRRRQNGAMPSSRGATADPCFGLVIGAALSKDKLPAIAEH